MLVASGQRRLARRRHWAVRGQGSDEQMLFRGLRKYLEPSDILFGDAFFPTYLLLRDLLRRGVDGLLQCGARRRSSDFELDERLGTRDNLIPWSMSKRPPWIILDPAVDRFVLHARS